jgi:hypothetical protein
LRKQERDGKFHRLLRGKIALGQDRPQSQTTEQPNSKSDIKSVGEPQNLQKYIVFSTSQGSQKTVILMP